MSKKKKTLFDTLAKQFKELGFKVEAGKFDDESAAWIDVNETKNVDVEKPTFLVHFSFDPKDLNTIESLQVWKEKYEFDDNESTRVL